MTKEQKHALDTLMKDIVWSESPFYDTDVIYSASLADGGRLTVLDRRTGFSNIPRDVESGYKDPTGKFWLAAGDFDVRRYEQIPVSEVVALVKQNANICQGIG